MNTGPILLEELIQLSYGTIVQEPDHAQTELILKCQQALCDENVEATLTRLFAYFDVEYSPIPNHFQQSLPLINALRQRVHISHFFLKHVIPKQLHLHQASLRLLELMMKDLQLLVASIGILYQKNQVPVGQAATFVLHLQQYHQLLKTWLPHYQQNCNKNPWPFYKNLIENELLFANILVIHGNREEAKRHFK